MGKLMDQKVNVIEDNYDQLHIPMSPNFSPSLPLDLSVNSRQFPFRGGSSSPTDLSIKPIQNNIRQMSVDDEYEPPSIITEPKRDWHYRSIKDLAKKHLPYLPGIGPQRTPIRVTVPTTPAMQMYLAMAIRTIDDEPHLSKVIVPAKTHVNAEHLFRDNDLNCLRFDECDSADYFDEYQRHIYSEISSAEHHRGYKENGEYVAVSQPSFSSIIEEKKMTARSRISTQMNQTTLMSNPYAQFYIDNPDDIDDDDDSV